MFPLYLLPETMRSFSFSSQEGHNGVTHKIKNSEGGIMKKLIVSAILILGARGFAQVNEAPPVEKTTALTREVTNDEQEVLLTDSFGKTLYTFDLDIGSATSKCKGDCAEVWPPYILAEEEKATLVAPFGFVERVNKEVQLTYKGLPLYTYILDRNEGEDKGDNIGGVWHYVEVEKITPQPLVGK